MREAVGWCRLTDKQAERGLKNTTFVICAREKGKAIAMGRVLFDFGNTAYIGDVAIEPNYQRQGIGTEIVERLLQKIIQSADEGDRIMILLESAKGKEPFYEKFGFQRNPNERIGCGMRKIVIK